jgi:hypothetical protein
VKGYNVIVDIPNAQNISKPLKRVTAAASKRSEIESCVLIESTADALTLTTIDAHTHELKLRVAEAIVCQEGQALINANLIKDLFGHLDNQAVNLSVTEKELFIKGEADVRLQLSSFNIAQFPQEEMSLPVVGKVNGEQFLSVLSRSRDLLSAGEFVSLVANQDKLTVYTRSGGSLFFQPRLGD